MNALDPVFPVGSAMPVDFPACWPPAPPGRSPEPLPLLRERIPALAADVGRLRRRVEPDSSLSQLADRLACHVESLHALLMPSAAELVAWTYPGDEETVVEAVRVVDEHWRQLQSRLGKAAA